MKTARTQRRRRRLRPGRALKNWLGQHARAGVFSLGQFMQQPFSNLLSTLVIGISLALPASFYLILDNAQRVIDQWEGSVRISLFLKDDVDQAAAQSLAETLRREDGISAVRYISREQALQEYRQLSGMQEAVDALGDNPLPAVLVVSPSLDALSSPRGEALLQRLNGLPQVDSARYDSRWVQRLLGILQLLRRGVIILAALLAAAILLIVGNTIRLAIHNRRAEIEINKLFGATDAFVQRPFLYTGLIHGGVGGLLAWLLVSIVLLLLHGPIDHLAGLYHSAFQLHGLGLRQGLLLVGCAAALGVAGSWLAVQRHLRAIDPS